MTELPPWLTTMITAAAGVAVKAISDAIKEQLSATKRLKKAEQEIAPSAPPRPAASPAPTIPQDVALLAKEVELVRTRDELREAQAALVRLRAALDEARFEKVHEQATRTQLTDAQESLRKLRSALDEARLDNTRMAGELAAQRGYVQRLMEEMRELRSEGAARPPAVDARYAVERVERKK